MRDAKNVRRHNVSDRVSPFNRKAANRALMVRECNAVARREAVKRHSDRNYVGAACSRENVIQDRLVNVGRDIF